MDCLRLLTFQNFEELLLGQSVLVVEIVKRHLEKGGCFLKRTIFEIDETNDVSVAVVGHQAQECTYIHCIELI